MINFLFLVFLFILLLLVSLLLTRNDWGSPATVVPVTFAICALAGVYNSVCYGFNLSSDAVLLIGGSVSLFTITSLSVSMIFRQASLRKSASETTELTPINLPHYVVMLGLVVTVITVGIHARETLSTFSLLGSTGSWNESMGAYRDELAYGVGLSEVGSSGMANALFKMLTPIAFIFMYVFFNNSYIDKRPARQWHLLFPAIGYLACELLTGVRLGAIRIICAALVVAWVLWSRSNKWSKRIKVSAFLKGLLYFVILCILFWATAWIVGRRVELGLLDYVCSYIGCSFVAFDLFLQDAHVQTALPGEETFVAIYGSIGRLLGDDSLILSGNHEFRSLHGVSLGNVYTAFRSWYADFGLTGMIIACLICSVVISVLYERARLGDRKLCIRYSLVGYSYFAAGLFAMPLVSLLSQTAFRPTTAIELFLIYAGIRIIDSAIYRENANLPNRPTRRHRYRVVPLNKGRSTSLRT